MSQSPEEDSAQANVDAYLRGWQELNTMLRRGGSFSGREANCCYLNVGTPASAGRFADISAVSGYDFIDDARGMALVDWDFDGDLDLWTTNRTGPRLRILRNNSSATNHYLAVKLEGTTCNRDAIGARVEVVLNSDQPRTIVRSVRAGESYLTQSSKWLHFGLGAAETIEQIRVRWPGETEYEPIEGANVDSHVTVVQGARQAQELGRPAIPTPPLPEVPRVEQAPNRVLVVGRIPFPPLSVKTPKGSSEPLYPSPGRPMLVNFWASWCRPCLEELADWTSHSDELESAGVDVVALAAANPDQSNAAQVADAQQVVDRLGVPFRWGLVDQEDVQLTERLIWSINADYQRPLGVPTSILLDHHGQIMALYRGAVDLDVVLSDVKLIEASPEQVRKAILPFAGIWRTPVERPGPMQLVAELQSDGKAEDAKAYLRHLLAIGEAGGEDPYGIPSRWMVDAAFHLGTMLLHEGRYEECCQTSRLAIEHDPTDFRPYENLGTALLQLRRQVDAIEAFSRSLEHMPGRTSVLAKRGLAYLELGKTNEAFADWEAALRQTPDDLVTRNQLAVESLKAGDERRAVHHLRELAARRPDSPEFLGNLAWLLATSWDPNVRNGREAERLSRQWCRLTDNRDPNALHTLAAALAENGKFEQAETTLNAAIDLARRQNQFDLIRTYDSLLRLYRQGKPYRRPSP